MNRPVVTMRRDTIRYDTVWYDYYVHENRVSHEGTANDE